MARADEIIAAYIKLRDKKDEIKARHANELKPINEKLDLLGTALLQLMQIVGTDTFKGEAGTAFRTLKTSATVADWDTLFTFIQEHDLWSMLEHRVSKTAVEEYKEVHGELPPGVNWSSMYDVNVRRK